MHVGCKDKEYELGVEWVGGWRLNWVGCWRLGVELGWGLEVGG